MGVSIPNTNQKPDLLAPYRRSFPMRLTMHERHAVVREISSRFQHARKKERGQILNEFVELPGYTRCYAVFVLRHCGWKQVRLVAGRRVVFIRAPGSKRQTHRALPNKSLPGGSATVLVPV